MIRSGGLAGSVDRVVGIHLVNAVRVTVCHGPGPGPPVPSIRIWHPSRSRGREDWCSRVSGGGSGKVAVPKCRLSGLSRPRWIVESLPSALPGPSRLFWRLGSLLIDHIGQSAFEAAHGFHGALA